jgi:hypothetical protein
MRPPKQVQTKSILQALPLPTNNQKLAGALPSILVCKDTQQKNNRSMEYRNLEGHYLVDLHLRP